MTLQVIEKSTAKNAVKGLRICRANRVVLSGRNAQLTTPPAMMMMVVGKKQVKESWRPKQLNQTQFKLRPANPIRATVSQLAARSFVVVVDNSRTCYLQGGCLILLSRSHLVLCLSSGLRLWGCYDRRSMDVLLTDPIPLAVIANICFG